MQQPDIFKSPTRTSSRHATTLLARGFSDSGGEQDDDTGLGSTGSDADESNARSERRRTTITGKTLSSSTSRIPQSASYAQIQQLGRPQRHRSTTAPSVSPDALPSRPSMSIDDRTGLPTPLKTTSSTRSPAVLSLHSASGSVSTVSTTQTRSLRSRSHTESSGYGTSITRPSLESTGGRKSTSSMWSMYPSMPQSLHISRPQTAPASPDCDQTNFTPPFSLPSPSVVSRSPQDAPSGWKAMARRASGKFRRSTSHNVPVEVEFTSGQMEMSRSTSSNLSPKASRARTKTISAPTSDAETDGSTGSGGSLLGGFLSRKKSSNSLRAEKAERNRAWSQMPLPGMSSSPSTMSMNAPTSPTQAHKPLRQKPSKLSIGTGRGKQRLDEVIVSPFDVHFHASNSSSAPLKAYTAEPEEDLGRPSLSTSLRPQTPPQFKRSVSHDSGSTTRQATSLRAPIPRSLSANSTASSSPHSPSSSQMLSPSMSSTSLTSASSLALDEDDLRPPVPPVPLQHRSESPGPRLVKFPARFGFVPRPEEEEDDFGASSSAASIPVPLRERLERNTMTSIQPKKKIGLDFDTMLETEGTITIKIGVDGKAERDWL